MMKLPLWPLKNVKAFFFIRIERIPETLKHYWLVATKYTVEQFSYTLPALRPCRRSFKEQEVLVHSVWPSKKMRKRTIGPKGSFFLLRIKKMPSQIPQWQGQSPFYFSFSTRHNVKTRKRKKYNFNTVVHQIKFSVCKGFYHNAISCVKHAYTLRKLNF
jgi:hypothetical protein